MKATQEVGGFFFKFFLCRVLFDPPKSSSSITRSHTADFCDTHLLEFSAFLRNNKIYIFNRVWTSPAVDVSFLVPLVNFERQLKRFHLPFFFLFFFYNWVNLIIKVFGCAYGYNKEQKTWGFFTSFTFSACFVQPGKLELLDMSHIFPGRLIFPSSIVICFFPPRL